MHLRRFFYRLGYPIARRLILIFEPHLTAVLCIAEHGGKFLLIRNTYGASVWNFPGGMVKKGEAPEDATRRELKEEAGIKLGAVSYLGTHSANRDGFKNVTIHCFYGKAAERDILIDPDEIAEAGWFVRGALPQPQSPAVPETIKLLKQYEIT